MSVVCAIFADKGGTMLTSGNFGYLRGHDIRLATLGAQAERYFREDPSTAIIKLRQLAELLAKLIAAHHALYRPERETFEETLRRLSPDGASRQVPTRKKQRRCPGNSPSDADGAPTTSADGEIP